MLHYVLETQKEIRHSSDPQELAEGPISAQWELGEEETSVGWSGMPSAYNWHPPELNLEK